MNVAVNVLEWTVGSLIVALVLILTIYWVTKDRRNRKLRVGFFLERERFDHEDDETSSKNGGVK